MLNAEKEYSNGRVVITVDGKAMTLEWYGNDGRREVWHCWGTSAHVRELMEDDPGLNIGW